mmetsp:Transcript_9148/g.15684  ORF Transcript_9148/g.15684 Transcript_9148/m.15684 type:complete len:224 (+) Transcript_9148:2373-3044(+)
MFTMHFSTPTWQNAVSIAFSTVLATLPVVSGYRSKGGTNITCSSSEGKDNRCCRYSGRSSLFAACRASREVAIKASIAARCSASLRLLAASGPSSQRHWSSALVVALSFSTICEEMRSSWDKYGLPERKCIRRCGALASTLALSASSIRCTLCCNILVSRGIEQLPITAPDMPRIFRSFALIPNVGANNTFSGSINVSSKRHRKLGSVGVGRFEGGILRSSAP